MIGLITAALLAQISIHSVVVQPSVEERVVFNHNGFTYFVGKQTGQVVVLESGKGPTPPPRPDDDKKPVPVVTGAAWFTLIIDPAKSEQAAWRTDAAVRSLVTSAKVEFRTYASTERDIDTLNLRSELNQGLPVVVIQDKDGRVIKTQKVSNLDDLKAVAGGLK